MTGTLELVNQDETFTTRRVEAIVRGAREFLNVPEKIQYRRAAHRAFEEYLIVSRHVSAATPIVLLYVSLAERYVHILPSRAVREKISDANWNAIVQTLTFSVSSAGAAKLLAAHFPKI